MASATLEIPVSDVQSKIVQMRAVVGAANAFAKAVDGPDGYASNVLLTGLIYELIMVGVKPEDIKDVILNMVEIMQDAIVMVAEADIAAMDQAEAAVKQ